MIEIDILNSSDNQKRIKIWILIIQSILYLCFLISHFLIWGFVIDPISPWLSQPFVGLEINSGIISIISLNGFFICGYINYLFFRFSKRYKIYNAFLILVCSALFIYILIGVYVDWEWVYLDQLVFGFYLWLFSVIGTIGVLFYLQWRA